jgi:hypothetical protein
VKHKLKKIGLISGVVLLVALSALNAYWLKTSYDHYGNSSSTQDLPTAKIVPKTSITSAKQQTLDAGRVGQLADKGQYKYEELDHSKLNSEDNPGLLVLASAEDQNANFILAGNTDLDLSADNLNSGWTAQKVNEDSIWQPASCASKPTYLIGGRYIFIDDGRTKATDKYNSYLVFDMVSQKYRYFGGDNFTVDQGQKEHILSVQNENGSVVFYIDHSDTSGPLAGSTSFKHAASYAAKYITRRVLDLSTLHFQDYKIPYQLPSGINYFFIDAGNNFSDGQIATLTTDTEQGDGYYSGTVSKNALSFKFVSYTSNSQSIAVIDDPLATDTLDQLLAGAMPNFVDHFDAAASNQKHKFLTSPLGTSGSVQYLIAHQSWTPNGEIHDNPAIYDTADHKVLVLTNKPILDSYGGGNYVALGVF